MIEILPLKKKGLQKPYFLVSVETMVGDADRFPIYKSKFETFTEKDELVIKYYNECPMSEKEEEDAESISDLILRAARHEKTGPDEEKWAEVLYHWDYHADDFERILGVGVVYFDENGEEHKVKIQ